MTKKLRTLQEIEALIDPPLDRMMASIRAEFRKYLMERVRRASPLTVTHELAGVVKALTNGAMESCAELAKRLPIIWHL